MALLSPNVNRGCARLLARLVTRDEPLGLPRGGRRVHLGRLAHLLYEVLLGAVMR